MPTRIMVPISEWAPDMPAFNMTGQSQYTQVATNVVPRTPTSWGPMPSLGGAVSNALTLTCQGAYACLDSSGNVNLFAGDANDLYQMSSSGSLSFSKVSKSAGGYNCPPSENWHMALFNNRVIATDYEDPIQSFVLGSSTAFADLSANAPKARYAAVVKSWLVVANVNDTTYGNGVQPQWVWWPANNDPTNWPQPGTAGAVAVQSSYQPLYGDGGQITGIVGNLVNADGVVFMEHAVWRMIYAGNAAVFSFYPAGNLRGCQAPNSIVQVGDLVYFLAEDGFYSFDGATSTPIGVNRVDKFLLGNGIVAGDLDVTNKIRLVGTADPKNKLIFWAYPGPGNVNGTPNRMLVYNWAIDRWSYVKVSVEWIVRALTFGYTLDQLYTILGYKLDQVPYPLSSHVWQGGNITMGGFDSSNKLNFFSGVNLPITVDLAEMQPAELIAPNTDQRSYVSDVRPLIDISPNSPSSGAIGSFVIGKSGIGIGPTPMVNVGYRNRLQDAVTYAGAVGMNTDGLCPQSVDGRYIQAEVTTNAGDVWSHFNGVVLTVDPSGSY